MSKTNCKKRNCVIYKQLDGMQLSEHERQRARYAVRDAEAIVHALIWVTEGIASLGAVLPKLGHACVVEDPEACATEIRRFVRNVD